MADKKEMKGEVFQERVGQALAQKKPALNKPSSKDEADDNYYQNEIKKIRAKSELKEAERDLKDIDKPADPPFKMTGEFNVGKFDLQEIQQKADAKAEEERATAADHSARMEAENKQVKEQLYAEKIEGMRSDFARQMELLQKTIENGSSTKKSFVDQFAEAQETAKLLGLEKTATGTNPTIEIEIKKLEWSMKREDREFSRLMKKDEREWQMRMEEIKDQRAFKQQEILLQGKKDEMFASFPQRIGGAIAKGMMESGDEAPGHITRQAGKGFHIEVGEGEAGEVDCPQCHTAVGIGPTATKAVCVGCDTRFEINRKPSTAEEPAEEEE